MSEELIPNFIEKRLITDEEESMIPPAIRDLIDNNPIVLGGSFALMCTDHTKNYSSIHWSEYDIDLYIIDKFYGNVKRILKGKYHIFKKIKKTSHEKKRNKKRFLYSNLKIENLTEYNFEHNSKCIKVQLVNIGDYPNFKILYNTIDLSFCSVLYCGIDKTFYFLRTTQLEIINRRGIYFPNNDEIRYGLNPNSNKRICKYISRGFKITNIDHFSEQKNRIMISIVSKTIISNWFNYLFNIDILLSLSEILDEKYKITESMINSVVNIIEDYDNKSMYLNGFLFIALSKNLSIIQIYYDKFLHKFDINIECYTKLMFYLIENGLYTAFKLIFQNYIDNIDYINNELLSMLMNTITQLNLINCALLMCKHIPLIEISIFEDRISRKWRIKTIFDVFLEIEDTVDNEEKRINMLIQQFSFLTNLSESEIEESNACTICNTSNANIKIKKCNHSFCSNCIFTQFNKLQKNKKPLICQLCRISCTEKN